MIIKNSTVLSENGDLKNCTIELKDGLIRRIIDASDSRECSDAFEDSASFNEVTLDGNGCYLIPGFIDIHLHGACGADFSTAGSKEYRQIRAFEARSGVTTICPTTMTIEKEALKKAVKTFAENSNSSKGLSDTAGLYLEGPFLSEGKRGAHDAAYLLPPDAGLLEELHEISGNKVQFCALAPELDNAESLIKFASEQGIRITLAHSNASYDQAVKAFTDGISHVTHFYNAMSSFTHREPGIVGAVFDRKPDEIELIADGIHVHEAAVRLAFEVLGRDRIIFISDSIEAAGMPDGQYLLGGQAVVKTGRKVTVSETSTIAGSASTLADIFRNAVLNMGIDFKDAALAATANPAKALGIFDRVGSISEGKIANLVLLKKEDLCVKCVILHGEMISGQSGIRK